MRDVALALVAVVAFGVFVGILVYEVPQRDLIVVVAIVLLFVLVDFARELLRKRG